MRVLVTGASGFTGRVLVRQLAAVGHDVIALTRSPSDEIAGAAAVVRGDLSDAATLKTIRDSIDGVCHVAASIVLGGSPEELLDCFRTNVAATYELLRFCEQRAVTRFVYSSSASVYARCEDDRAIDEQTAVDPHTPYAASKLAGEWLVSSRLLRSVRAAVLRYSSIYGQGQKANSVLPIFVRRVISGERPSVYGSGARSQDFVHVDDVCEANRLALESEAAAGETFNIGSGEETSMTALAGAVVERFGGSGFDRIEVESEDRTRFRFDVSKARRLLRYTPRTLADGLRTYSAR